MSLDVLSPIEELTEISEIFVTNLEENDFHLLDHSFLNANFIWSQYVQLSHLFDRNPTRDRQHLDHLVSTVEHL